MKYMHQMRRYGARLALAGTAFIPALSFADTTDPATTAATQIATLSTEFNTVYTAAFTVMLGIVVALVVWKYSKKLGLKV